MKPVIARIIVSTAAAFFAMSMSAQGPISPSIYTDQVLGGTGGNFEHVDLSNGGVNINIPLVAIKGRGVDFVYSIRYSSKNWFISQLPQGQVWTFKTGWTQGPPVIYRQDASVAMIWSCIQYPQGWDQYYVYEYYNEAIEDDRSQWNTPYIDFSADQGAFTNCLDRPYWQSLTSAYSTELGSHMSVRRPDGGITGLDGNGNYVYAYVTVQNNGIFSLPEYLTLPDNRQFHIIWTSITLNTAFATPALAQNCSGCTMDVISRVDLPNGSSWSFSYGPYGELKKVTSPLGGYIRYEYATLPNFSPPTMESGPSQDGLVVTDRYESADGETENHWNYSYSYGDSNRTVTETNPLSEPTIHTYSQLAFGEWDETDTQVKNASGTVLRTSHNDFACDIVPRTASADPFPGINFANGNCRKTDETVSLNDINPVLQRKTHWDYDQDLSATVPSRAFGTSPNDLQTWPYTTTRGNITAIKEYDWGQGAPGPLLRETDNTYLTTNSVNGTQYDYRSLGIYITNRLQSQAVKDGNGVPLARTDYEYDQNALMPAPNALNHDYVYTPIARGNVTAVKRCANVANCQANWLTTTNVYDELGNLRSTTDPKGHTTQFGYTDCFSDGVNRSIQSYVTTKTNAKGQQEKYCYYFASGLAYWSKDQNDINAGRNGTVFSYDNMNRLTSVVYPDGGQTDLSYPNNTTAQRQQLQCSHQAYCPNSEVWKTDYTYLDGFGRVKQTQIVDPEGDVFTEKTYDVLGRVHAVTNSHRSTSAATDGTTQYAYDPLGRVQDVIEQDDNIVHTDYSGNCAIVRDETNRKRRSCSDALGRLTAVWEDTDNLNYETDYKYDALGNLKCVEQHGGVAGTGCSSDPSNDATSPWRIRRFTYDSVSQLLSAKNPESGTVSYSYNEDGNVASKTDARGILTTFVYDQLHRPTQKAFSDDTPSVFYIYEQTEWLGIPLTNTVGRLTEMWTGQPCCLDSGILQLFGYDPMGRVVENAHYSGTTGSPYHINAQFDRAGRISTLTYPSGRTIISGYNSAGHQQNVVFDSFAARHVGFTYWSAISGNPSDRDSWGYWPNGMLKSAIFGNDSSETESFNARLQPWGHDVIRPPSLDSPGAYWWSSHVVNTTDSSGHNNGNITSITDNLNVNATQNFDYDSLNRLTLAWTNGNLWANRYQIDAWGNLNKMLPCADFRCNSKPEGQHLDQLAGTNNRFIGFSYDLAGNLLANGMTTYQYDAENRLHTVNANGAIYTYDADGLRVRKDVGIDSTEYIYFGGQVLAEYNPATGDWSDYIYANGRRIARADTYDDAIHVSGTNCSSCGTQWTVFQFPGAAGLNGYVVQPGDKLYWAQYQPSTAQGGIELFFNHDSINTIWNLRDQDGILANQDTTSGYYHRRIADLSNYAGDTIDNIQLNVEYTTPAGNWSIYYADIVLVSADGIVHPIYSRQRTFSLGVINTSGVNNITYGSDHWSGAGPYAEFSTTFYHQDHIGSSRLLTSYYGWPVWQGTFLPFGAEFNPQDTTNHYKFTGKERDSETGLDYFGARYYGSTMGRFLSPDWAAAPIGVPYAMFGDPQSLNLYSYVRNNPMAKADPDGHCADDQNCSDLKPNPLNRVTPGEKQAINQSVKASDTKNTDDPKGRSHEEGGVSYTKDGQKVIARAQPGPYKDVKQPGVAEIDPYKAADPALQKPGDVQADVVWHVHPSAELTESTGPSAAPGTVILGGTTRTTTYNFTQPPSAVDIGAATPQPTLNLVIGARSKTVYVYTNSGTQCTESVKDINKEPK